MASLPSRSPGLNTVRAGDVEQRAKAINFRSERLATGSRNAVVSAPLVSCRYGRRGLLHPPRFHQPLKGAVNRAGAEAKSAGRLALHVLQDRVAVPFAAGKGKKDVDNRRGQGRHVFLSQIYL
jgi:hypothetical protein